MYNQEASQKLNREIAAHIADHDKVFVNGLPDTAQLHKTFHNVMIYNPATEIYLLDTEGRILDYFAPKSIVKLERVNLQPIDDYIADEGHHYCAGDDPRHPGEEKVFSAAKVFEDDVHRGYIYVILGGDKYASATAMLDDSYFMQLGTKGILITLAAALLLGLIIIRLLTRNLNRIVTVVRRFREGDHEARIALQSRGELTHLADDFNQMADTITNYINEIKSVESLRRELIANVSHDLRTPLAAIQGYAETLVIKSDSLTEEEKVRYTNVILQGTEKVKKLVDDLFELSKLETKQVEAQFEHFSLAELVADVSAKYELMAKEQEVELVCQVPRNLPMIRADIALIDRVLQNLVDNALKYTPANGKVTVTLEKNPNGLRVMVADTGLGIPQDDLPYIFDRYRQGRSRKKEGVGLGLAIVKKILELHQTDIAVSSEPNRGTQFSFMLPVMG